MRELAQAYNMQADGRRQTIGGKVETDAIIEEVIALYKLTRKQPAELARRLKRPTVEATARAVWKWIRDHIRYRIDPIGFQFSKSPARTLSDGYADCKGMSILAASILYCLKIPHKFRFTAYTPQATEATHVYVVAIDQSREIPLDPVMGTFSEKPFTYKKDIMPKLVRLTGIGNTPAYTLPEDRPILEGELDLYLMREQIQAERDLMAQAGIQGIGSVVNAYDEMTAVLDMALAEAAAGAAGNMELIAQAADEEIEAGLSGFFKRVAQKAKNAVQKVASTAKNTKAGQFIQNAANKVKQGIAAAKGVVNQAQKSFFKKLVEVMLPQAAPAFLPLFAKDPATVQALPADWKRRREFLQGVSRFMVDTLGMKESHFMQILRTGIMKRMGGAPEVVLEKELKGISGVGAAAIITAAISIIPSLVQKIGELFNKKKETGSFDFSVLKEPLSKGAAAAAASIATHEKRQAPAASVPSQTAASTATSFVPGGAGAPFTGEAGANFPSADSRGGGGGGNNTLLYGAAAAGVLYLLSR